MRDKAQLKVLARIAAMKKEADLMAVARAEAARGHVKARLDALDDAATAARQDRATDVASLAAQESFSRLIAAQRAGLDRELAVTTEILRSHRDAAALSFGRSRVLDQLRERVVHQSAMRQVRRGNNTF